MARSCGRTDAAGAYRISVSTDITFAARTCLHLEATPNTPGLLSATRTGITYTFGLSQDSIAVNFTIVRQ